MKYFIILCIISEISSIPISDSRIVYPDEFNSIQVDNRIDGTDSDQISLLDNPNIIKSVNATNTSTTQHQQKDKNPENGKFFQGDIVLLDEQLDSVNDTSGSAARTGLSNIFRRWPKNAYGKVVVPFTISNDFSFDDKATILSAMYDIESHTCIKFKQQSHETDYIYIISDEGCYSYIGRKFGPQVMSLQRDNCIGHGHIIHELIHALGFHHMHNHIDRNNFVTIYSYNIDQTKINQFITLNPSLFENFGTPYDYYSVMHYDTHTFSANGMPTILPNDHRYRNVLGQRIGLSQGDVKRINSMYQCNQVSYGY
ncbi:hatching enzyme 1.2-like [Chironomus tepperi]|uniref:hatching enzyme 1.2-like n=1 Tax=Chironomus tepperi TaxID=113505 RepID=UPI00391EE85C